jgi:hypothetical protein
MALERWLHERLENGDDITSVLGTLLEKSRSVGIAGVLVSFGKRDPQRLFGVLQPLTVVAEFQFWERAKQGQVGGSLPSLRASREEVSRRVEWNELPFRKLDLLGVCLELFATSANAREQLGALAAQWRTRLDHATENDLARGFLPQLIDLFDVTKWTPGQDERGLDRWTYQRAAIPESVDTEIDIAVQRLELLTIPGDCRRCLDGQNEELAANPEALWQLLEQIAREPKEEGAPSPVVQAAGISFSLIAVLIVKCRDWLLAHPEAEQVCRDAILAFVPAPEPPSPEYQIMMGDREPQTFYADALVGFWAESIESVDLRLHVARFVASASDQAVAALCRRAFFLRTKLGAAFLQLQTFVLHAAVTRSRRYYAHALKLAPDAFEKWVRQESVSFANGYPHEYPTDWTALRHKQFPMPHGHRSPVSRSTERLHYGLDFEYLVAAFSWIPQLDKADSPTERQHWIAVRFELLRLFLATFPAHQGREDHYEGAPYRAERDLLARTADLMLQLKADEKPAHFWKPVLRLGMAAQHWVDDFVTDFFSFALEPKTVSPEFTGLWGEMIGFAMESPTWKSGGRGGGHERERLWLRLLGIGAVVRFLLLDHHASILAIMWPRVRAALEAHIRDGESVPELCQFLRQPDAAEFLGDGLIFLERLCTANPDRVFDRHDLVEQFAHFLAAIREAPAIQDNSTGDVARAYRSLVALLAARQNPVALQLQRELGRTAPERITHREPG